MGLVICSQAFAQKKVTVSGHITDDSNGETLIGAGILEGSIGTVTNNYGFYTLSLPKGSHTLTYTYIGYADQSVSINLQKDTTINIVLKPNAQLESSTVVASKDAGFSSTKMGALELPVNVIKNTPVLFGEHDVLKTIQLMPGVQSGGDGFSGMYVRGGGPDENLLLLDGIPLYNAEHMLGIFSIFQPEAVKKVTLYKSSFPSRYGGRVSSIVDIRTNDGNMKEFSGTVGVGVISDKFHLEGPIIKDKLAFSASARSMHTMLLRPLIKNTLPVNYYFYDLNGKLSWRISDKDRLYLIGYHGRDVFQFKNNVDDDYTDEKKGESYTANETEDFDIKWGNTLSALNWNHIFSNRLFANVTAAYTHYIMDVDMAIKSTVYSDEFDDPASTEVDMSYKSGMRDFTLKTDFDYTPNHKHLVKFGAEYIHHVFSPQTASVRLDVEGGSYTTALDSSATVASAAAALHGNEVSAYIEDDFAIGDHVTINPGFRMALFFVDGKTYFCPEPRFSAKYAINDDLSLKAAYSRMSQYVHLLSYSTVSLPVDLWVPITKTVKPVIADQISGGVYYNGLEGWQFSLEAYYKWTRNLLEYKDGVTLMTNSGADWESAVEMGKGYSRGIELLVEKKTGKTTGWLGYTLAWSDRQFEKLNGGKRFPYQYDRRHNISLVVNHKFNEKLSLSGTWTFASGGYLTVPVRQGVVLTSDGRMRQAALSLERNNYKLPPTHLLNLGLNYKVPKKRGDATWDFSIYNVYNRMNPNFVFTSSALVPYRGDVKEYQQTLTRITLLPFIPSIGWTRTF